MEANLIFRITTGQCCQISRIFGSTPVLMVRELPGKIARHHAIFNISSAAKVKLFVNF